MNLPWKLGPISSAAVVAVLFSIAPVWTMATSSSSRSATVVVRGNRELSEEELGKLMSDARAATPEVLAKKIQTAYIERGLLKATVRLEKSSSDSTPVLVIEEGTPSRFGTVKVRGPELVVESEVRDILGARMGDRFDPRALKNGLEKLLEYYDARGYPFAQVWVDSLEYDDASNTVGLSMYVVEGGRKTISRVVFEGLDHTREGLAVKLSGLKTGELYDGERIRESYLRLTTSGVFEEVSYPVVRVAPDAAGVEALIKVLEPKGRNSASAAIGFAEREGAQDRVLSGLVRLDLSNIGGSLRDLHALWKNDGQGRHETRLSYRERFFLGRRLGLGVALEQVGLDTLYTWQSLGLESTIPAGRRWGGLAGVDAAVYGDRNTFSQGDVSNTLRIRLAGGVNFVAGHEDRGGFLEVRARPAYARKRMSRRAGGRDESVSQYIFETQLRATADLLRNAHGVVEMTYRGIESSEDFVPLSEQFYAGGAGTIRGYRENQFHGRRVAYSRTELRLGRNRRENGYLFVDGGYVLQESLEPSGRISKNEELPVGFGFGLRTESRVGNIDISFGVGDELSLRQTKVHVILNRTF